MRWTVRASRRHRDGVWLWRTNCSLAATNESGMMVPFVLTHCTWPILHTWRKGKQVMPERPHSSHQSASYRLVRLNLLFTSFPTYFPILLLKIIGKMFHRFMSGDNRAWGLVG